MPQIIITFTPDDRPRKIETQGFAGETCKAASAPYEAILGGQVVSDKPTQELYDTPVTDAVRIEGQ